MNRKPHPADFLNEILTPLAGRSDAEIARLLGLPLSTFHAILRREAPITQQTAEVLGKLFRTGMDFWMQMQDEYDRSMEMRMVADDPASGLGEGMLRRPK